jgi:16S rRNA (guanine527-N7)-methyltransferase
VTEDEGKYWACARFPDAIDRLARLVAIVREEAANQNLVARSTLDALWARHVVDSLQLIPLAPASGAWLDIGTGAGFPGLAIAATCPDRAITLVEPRRLRADYLLRAAVDLGLENVEVVAAKIESVEARPPAVISARAVARLDPLLRSAHHISDIHTFWALPKGRSAAEEVAEARRNWHGVFHVEHSITDPDSHVVTVQGVRPR